APDRAGLHQEGRGPTSLLCRRNVPGIRARRFSRHPETPARVCAQGSHHAFPRSGGEPASSAPGGGRRGLCAAVSSSRPAYIRGPHSALQTHRAALCLLWRSAERECCLQTE
ncbi:hypothetical protein M9458_036856, partial [Cirrhinus mrigala]